MINYIIVRKVGLGLREKGKREKPREIKILAKVKC